MRYEISPLNDFSDFSPIFFDFDYKAEKFVIWRVTSAQLLWRCTVGGGGI